MLTYCTIRKLLLFLMLLSFAIIQQACIPNIQRSETNIGGRLLLIGERRGTANGVPKIFELVLGTEILQPLWMDVPVGRLDRRTVLSPDNRYAVLWAGGTESLDLTTGAFNPISVPGGATHPTFSPNGDYLAYVVRGDLISKNLGSDEAEVVFVAPCEEYTLGGPGITYCGSIGQPVWIDETTLAFDAFVGAMPSTITGSTDPKLDPNHALVVTVDGELIHEFDQALGIFEGKGPTIIVEQGDGWAWLEASALARGIFQPNPLNSSGYRPLLSPDGELLIVDFEPTKRGKQQLVELRTGMTKTITEIHIGQNVAWSPDGYFIATLFGLDNERKLQIVSLEDGSEILMLEMDEIPVAGDDTTPRIQELYRWMLLAWLP